MKNILRHMIEQPGIHAAPAVYDCIGALAAERAGFDFIFSSGFGIAASLLGKPDFGYLTASEMIDAAKRIAGSVAIPLLADMDTGYGNPLNVIRTVQDVVQSPVAGIILEDQEWPKKCGHFEGKRLVSVDEQVEKIKAAVYARGDSGLVIVARTDARAVEGLNGAIARGERYLAAGADVLFVEAPQSREELAEVARHFQGVPLFANIIEGGKTPNLSVAELDDMGYKLVAFALSGLFSATQALIDCFNTLKADGSTANINSELSFEGFKDVIRMNQHLELENRFGLGEGGINREIPR
ncbi:isocitrate lyase/PEP mutase family protein [Methylomonas methanica]|uniref:Carboxyvinyl-carboxyphosphonate phosphorylmutase n=1 Tax=Methylomonas methanica (strain DSM 25384 / MC09) TaxID=857087 RepID=F9ZZ95_METMM|nr:oxaloacetate decarboxylase [Methylomonas methanica]AEG01121.1 Carboxyvinyl-carboxyphosphonate phosphorylmutase [Methylomonas methanica MC09]